MLLPEVHGVGKSLNPSVQPEKQVTIPMISKVRYVWQIKPRLQEGRAGIKCKTKTPIVSPIVQAVENN